VGAGCHTRKTAGNDLLFKQKIEGKRAVKEEDAGKRS